MSTEEITLEQVERGETLIRAAALLSDELEQHHKSYMTEPYRKLEHTEAFREGKASHAAKAAGDAIFDYLLAARHCPDGAWADRALKLFQERGERGEEVFTP